MLIISMRKQGYGSSKFTEVEVAEARQKSELPHSLPLCYEYMIDQMRKITSSS